MSSLTAIDKRYLEKILGMESGYVLDFSDATFGDFFANYNIDIHSEEFQSNGTSKAKKMRAFWNQSSDIVIAKILSEMLDWYETDCELNEKSKNTDLLEKCRIIVLKLSDELPVDNVESEVSFLGKEFAIPDIHKLPVETQVASIIEGRLDEARKALNAGAHLSVIFLCGSVLEGVLLGVAQKNPEKFNRSESSPKNADGKVKQLHNWSLAQLINVACDTEVLKPDIKVFSHGLRDFRNYIHPYQQMLSGFSPDEHTARVCFQVLKAALANLVGSRR